MSIAFFRNLEFDLPSALLRELTQLFASLRQAPLEAATLAEIPEAQGVYQLFLDGHLVYVGKTDAEAGLNKRLTRHAQKVHHRKGLDPRRVTCKAVRVYVFTAMDLEQQLIKYYQAGGDSLAWNNSGFGANDPGRERDTTKLKKGHFDLNYPIDIDIPIEVPSLKRASVSDVLSNLKLNLPYTLRFEAAAPRSRKPHPDLVSATVSLSSSPDTLRSILLQLKVAMGDEWQFTLQPGYVTVYKENKNYPHGIIL